MSVSSLHILEQGGALAAIGRVAWSTFQQHLRPPVPKEPVAQPGPTVLELLPRRSHALVQDYVRHVGGDPARYGDTLPPHFFAQWAFGIASRTLEASPYPVSRVINLGCRLLIRTPLPASEPLTVSARLERIDDDGRRAVITTRVITSTASAPSGLTADMISLIPLTRGDTPRKGRPVVVVPSDAQEVASIAFGPRAGLDFAKVTGDFNPIHWVPSAARAAGFPNVVLQGYGTIAYTLEALNRSVFGGDVHMLREWQCSLTRPVVLPSRAQVYVRDEEVYVGSGVGMPVFLHGRFTI